MSLTHVNSGGETLNSTTINFTFNYGFTPTDGNILIAAVTKRGSSTSMNSPAGWIDLFSGFLSYNTGRTLISYKIADNESSSGLWTANSGSGSKWVAGITEWNGQDEANPINQSAFGTAQSASADAPSITPDVDGCLIVSGTGVENLINITVNNTVLDTERWNEVSSSGGSVSCAGGTGIQATAGPTGVISHVLSGSAHHCAYSIAIAPAAAAGPAIAPLAMHHRRQQR